MGKSLFAPPGYFSGIRKGDAAAEAAACNLSHDVSPTNSPRSDPIGQQYGMGSSARYTYRGAGVVAQLGSNMEWGVLAIVYIILYLVL